MMKLEHYLSWKNLTQARFAEQVDVNQSTISKLVTGSKKPTWATAAKIEKATGGAVPVAVWAQPDVDRHEQGAA